MKKWCVVGILLAIATTAQAKPFGFEFGLSGGGATARDKQDQSIAGIYLGAYADLNAWLLKAEGRAMAMKYKDHDMTYEFSGNGSALFAIQVHDILIRSFSPRGTQARAAVGLGGEGGIGNDNYNVALGLSAGAIALRWTPLRGEIGEDLTTGLGPYAGAVMRVKLKRFKNEVRVTVCATSNFGSIDDPEINWDGALDDLKTLRNKCILTEGNVSYDVIRIPFVKIAPELRWRYEELPENYESPDFILTLGARGSFEI